jgi:hypothetical protein
MSALSEGTYTLCVTCVPSEQRGLVVCWFASPVVCAVFALQENCQSAVYRVHLCELLLLRERRKI